MGADSGAKKKKFMFVNRRAPHGTIYALEALEVMLIGAAFEQEVSVVFLDDGIFQLVAGQDTYAVQMKNFAPAFGALKDYDLEAFYVEKESMEARGIAAGDLLVPVSVKNTAEIADLMESHDVILSF